MTFLLPPTRTAAATGPPSLLERAKFDLAAIAQRLDAFSDTQAAFEEAMVDGQFDVHRFADALDAQVAARRRWQENMVAVAGRFGLAAAHALIDLGPASVDLAEEMAHAEVAQPMQALNRVRVTP